MNQLGTIKCKIRFRGRGAIYVGFTQPDKDHAALFVGLGMPFKIQVVKEIKMALRLSWVWVMNSQNPILDQAWLLYIQIGHALQLHEIYLCMLEMTISDMRL